MYELIIIIHFTKSDFFVKFRMKEETNKVLVETGTYPVASLLSDIGGAAGLFLGLNVIGNRNV